MIYANLQDEQLLNLVTKHEDEVAFREIYNRYWKEVFWVAYRKVKSKEPAEELVQNLFLSLWERRREHAILNLQSWLFGAIKFSIINYYKVQMVHEKYVNYVQGNVHTATHTTEEITMLSDLSEAIEKGIELLPHKTGVVFRLSRFENRTVKEIAKDLDISEKAVEYHITQSLKIMRLHLKDYFVAGLIFLNLL